MKINIYQIKMMLIGLIAGIINGLFGSGGGTILVPAMVFILHIEDHKAHATAISIILPLSIISTIIYFKKDMLIFKVAIIVIIGGMIGSFIGSKLLNKIPTKFLRKIFGTFMIFAAIRMIIG